MTIFETARFALPLLAAGQAHKELFHNEALLLLDFLIHPVVQAVADDPQILSPVAGQSWLVGPSPVAEWSGRSGHIVGWSDGGWHFVKSQESMKIMVIETNQSAVYRDGEWHFIEAINVPVDGAIVDIEARSAIDSILAVLRIATILPQIPSNDSGSG
ncbi:DUF2793 domain-containing protein [Parasphingorhabdus cellanae]|uniref:DUF2793 domain-containing protein n=1 Tax=Parasphingorhabdus cellanae TaxID=2806553 RepID=A0ABX7T8T4_9SPHN|nr:DUF2793 domain-containing protein [Parasphingorhabdus cellanae]QTD57551.1 DUF2793 domain-containing protein [Parasphingorhabdus cellanae]